MKNLEDILASSKDLKLLYVEDDEEARKSVLYILREFFDDIIIGVNGGDGFEKFTNNSIDLIITDINMPVLNGLEMIEKIRHLDNDIPILILSAHNEVEYFMQSIQLGVDGYLLKPIQLEQFMKILSKSIKNLKFQRENFEYKNFLEEKVKLQVQELRERDALLLQQAKMASMGEMIDAIAHQWLQPINIISIQKNLIELDLQDDTLNEEHIQEAIDKTTHQIAHLISTMREFRSFIKPSSNITGLNISVLLESIMLLLQDELVKYNISVEILCDKDISIYANENDIKHLFINLINNAKDEIALTNMRYEDRIININCTKDNNRVNFLVKDRGRGIPQESLSEIFKPHFTTKEDEGGSGIGLYMCKQIVDKYAGSIDVTNDNGAIFNISFPLLLEN